jgi:galactokinase
MSITHRIAIASGFALALLASTVAPASSAPIASPVVASHVQLTAAADVTSAGVGLQSVLTASEMSLIQGDGPWQKLKKWVQKQIKWVNHFIGEVQRVVTQIEAIIEILFGNDDTPDPPKTIVEENVTTTNEYYASDADLDAGNLVGSDQSETGFYVASVTYGGGGGGTCLTDDGSCQYAY